jgi:hypothetical protein
VGWDDKNSRPTFTHNLLYDGATGQIRFHYDSDSTDELLFASKRWTIWNPLRPGQTGRRRMTIYRPDLIERYEADGRADGWRFLTPAEIGGLPNPQYWTSDGTAGGEALGIPVIPFENPTGSEIRDVIAIQELLNHSLSTFDIATDFHGLPLLWMRNMTLPIDPTTGKSIIPDFGPGQALLLEDGGEAGRVEPADLIKLFTAGVLSWIQVLAIVKGWPSFVFETSQQPPSGIALQIMEGSLVKQVEDKQAIYGGAWRDAFDIARRLSEIKTGQALTGEIELVWESAKTSDEMSAAQTNQIKWESAQVPIIQRWREAGYSKKEIDQMILDKGREDDLGLVDTVLPFGQ